MSNFGFINDKTPCISVYQKRVLGLLIDLKNQYKMAQPTTSSAHIEKITSMEEFQDVEQRLRDKDAFDALVGFTSRKYRFSALAHCLIPLGSVSQFVLCTWFNRWQKSVGRAPRTVSTKFLTGMFQHKVISG